jgi:hypothetical protein
MTHARPSIAGTQRARGSIWLRIALIGWAATWLLVGCLSVPPVTDPGFDGPIVLPGPDPDPVVPGPDPVVPGPDPEPPAGPPDPDPTPPVAYTVSVGPEAPVVLAGLEVRLVATVDPPYEGQLVWASEAGPLSATGTEAIFRAPAAAGRYRVSASVPDTVDATGVVEVTVPGGLAEPFTLIALPDTQSMVRSSTRAPYVEKMGQWIVAEREARNIAFVTHVGDIVWNPDVEIEWTRARLGLDLLDGVVPYSVAIGDHEYFPEEDKAGSTEAYLTHFGPERYAAYDWYLGAHADGLSHAQRFSAGGRDFLHLAIEWEPFGSAEDPSSPLGWAVAMLELYPTLPTIITTHAYLWDMPGQEGHFPDWAREGFVRVDGRKTFSGASGVALFETLVEPFPQVFMVLNGHYHKAELPDKGKFHQVSVNRAGMDVYEMLANFQSWVRGGDGYLRVIEFVPAGGADGLDQIRIETYSPSGNRYQDDERARFSFDLDFGLRFGGP